jgi:uncharacterized protein (TIGR00369 family)
MTSSRGQAAHLTGKQYIEAMIRGELPRSPMSTLMGYDVTYVEEGRVRVECQPGDKHTNLMGVAHGGLACTLLDAALGLAIQSTLPAGVVGTTLEIKVNMVRPITPDVGKLTCEGNIVHPGRRVATSEGRITDSKGKLYAHGTTTMMVVAITEPKI